ncbi:MAG TPA: type II toxin-antitoxin system HicA family toxin [Allosphingosinicella sp.]|nr:type II toxin-antitoxin system HicA family toxin [Allosphingosinicella sp.]
MTKPAKLYANLLVNPAQVIAFRDFERLLQAAGFECKRERGSHRSYRHPRVPEVLTVQPKGKDAQSYQVRMFLDMMRRHGLGMEE